MPVPKWLTGRVIVLVIRSWSGRNSAVKEDRPPGKYRVELCFFRRVKFDHETLVSIRHHVARIRSDPVVEFLRGLRSGRGRKPSCQCHDGQNRKKPHSVAPRHPVPFDVNFSMSQFPRFPTPYVSTVFFSRSFRFFFAHSQEQAGPRAALISHRLPTRNAHRPACGGRGRCARGACAGRARCNYGCPATCNARR